nr:ABC transporter ATP-binding protein [Candidatus Omnitrophota bacterium]
MKNYLKLLSFLKGHRKLFSLAVVTMFISSFFEVFQLSLLVPMTDRIFNNKQIVIPNNIALPQFIADIVARLNAIEPVVLFPMFLIGFIIMMIVKNIAIFLSQYLMNDVSQRIMADIRERLYMKIQNLSLDYFSEKRTGELISRITFDTGVVENAVSYGVIDLFRQTFVIILCIITAFLIDPHSSFVILVVFPLISWPMAQIGRKLRKISKGTQEKMADINTLLLETISGVKLVRAFCTEDYETKRFKAKNFDYYKLRMKSIKRLSLVSPLTELIGAGLGVVLVYWFGGRLMQGELSFGVFILFFGAVMSIISPIKKLGNVNALTQQALAANTRIYEVLDAEVTIKENPHPIVLKEMQKGIAIKDVDFHYYHEDGLILKNINLEIKKGELVAIVGPTGTGKTTLANLIPRFYDPCRGVV